MLGAIKLGGGDFNALTRHGTAALLNSVWLPAYEFSAYQVLDAMYEAFDLGNTGDWETFFAIANERDHSFCAIGAYGE